jgi:uncharacterized cupredoxin-like copper-binding protein/Cu/Ag efflux protein CusF
MGRLLPFLLLSVLATVVAAHGDKPSSAIDYSKAEETPFGRAADPRKAKRTIRVAMTDQMRFIPATVTVKRGDVVRFLPVNKGKVMHEMVLGTMEDLKQHAELMKKHPDMEHDEPHMAHVAPGKTGELGWQFTMPGEFYYGCLIPGHFEAGMFGKVVVSAGDEPPKQQKDAALGPNEGLVRKIDKAAREITLRHGRLADIDMPPMTMVFQFQDASMVERVKPGDKVKFRVELLSGRFTVTQIHRLPAAK